MKWLTRTITHHPYMIGFSSLIISLFCIFSSVFLIDIPSFSDPQLGFETRGTILANRYITWLNLLKEIKPSGLLNSYPKLYHHKRINPNSIVNFDKQHRIKRIVKTRKLISPFFCGNPGSDYSKFVVKSSNNTNIFSYENLQLLCKMENLIMGYDSTKSVCEMGVIDTRCCRTWSIDNFVAFQNNRTSCTEITPKDIENTLNILEKCSKYFHKKTLTFNCFERDDCKFLPGECTHSNIAFNILYYLMDKSFLQGDKNTDFTSVYLPIAKSTGVLNFFYDLENHGFEYFNKLEIVAIDFGLKDTLFDEYILNDFKYIIGGLVFVLLSIWFYTESICITIVVIYSIIASLCIAYFIYKEIFLLSFFPFMNILAVVVSIGIGADDAFVFCKFWNAPEYMNVSIEFKLLRTFQHAIVSIFLTSLTTAIAFYSSIFSSITAIRLFSIFSGTVVIVNFLIMITLFPTCVVILQQLTFFTSCKNSILKRVFLFNWHVYFQRCCHIFEQCIVLCVLKLRWIWFLLLTILALAATISVWMNSNLHLPNHRDFQLFKNSHIFERYDFIYKDHFLSEVDLVDMYKIPIRFVWGVNPIDNGNYMDPYSHGTITFDDNFDVSHPKSQRWLLNFCRNLKTQSFFLYETGPQFLNCFIESFIKWMNRRCIDPVEKTNLTPCCDNSTFPFKRSIFKKCIIDYMDELSKTPSSYFSPNDAGPKFIRSNIKALIVEFSSNYSYTYSYYEMDKFITSVENWMQEQLLTAPGTMKNGWFVSDYDFYDLQKSLANDTYIAMLFSMGLSFLILLIVTGNILVSLFATLTVILIIQLIIATLILLGWRLNILESIALSSSIGLTIDFSLHYSIGFVLNERMLTNSYMSTKYTLNQMVAPTTMACITTAFAGIFMLPSNVQPYIQIGTFLIVAMLFSWIYSTFYFSSLLAIFSPNTHYGYCNYKYFEMFFVNKRHGRNDLMPEEIPLNYMTSQEYYRQLDYDWMENIYPIYRSASEPLLCRRDWEKQSYHFRSLPNTLERSRRKHKMYYAFNESPSSFV